MSQHKVWYMLNSQANPISRTNSKDLMAAVGSFNLTWVLYILSSRLIGHEIANQKSLSDGH